MPIATATTCYLVTVSYTSGTAFSTVDTDNSAIVSYSPSSCSTAWAANTNYAVGAIFSQGGICYYVVTAYTSGTDFGTADTANANAAYVAGAPTSRTIYTKGSSGLANFAWNGSLSVTQQAYFTSRTGLSQFCTPPVSLPASAVRPRPKYHRRNRRSSGRSAGQFPERRSQQ